MISLIILGNNSALPAHGRHPTAQILQTPKGNILIDCGEGTQSQLVAYKVKPGKIHSILISHMHGDHYFGLIGMLTSMGLMGRTDSMQIYAPAALQHIIEAQLDAAHTVLPFPVIFHHLENLSGNFIAADLKVEAFATDHRIPCWGFSFTTQSKPRSINKEAVDLYQIPISSYEALQQGANFTGDEGNIILNELLTTSHQQKKYVYCADTRYTEQFLPILKDADLMYHEATYLKADAQKAYDRYHSTSEQAAIIASKAGVKKLLLGHFSSKYTDLSAFRNEAQEIFRNTEIAEEGCCFII